MPRPKRDARHKEVENFLETTDSKLQYKVLLLGTGESGKSTVLKQIKTIYKIGRTDEELAEITCAMHVNAVENMQILCNQAEEFGIKFSTETQEHVDTLRKCSINLEPPYGGRVPPQVASAISALWLSQEIQNTYERSNEFWILDSCEYYFKNVERFVEEDYVPTEEDAIMARVRTQGILETKIQQDPIEWSIIDVAGQKGSRKKWVTCFDNVKCVIFLVNLAGYNAVCWEDPLKNQMHDTVELFKEIVNLPTFHDIPFYLFFNKKDLFEQMIRKFPLANCYPQFKGLAKFANADVTVALEYLTSKFQEQLGEDLQDKKLPTVYMASRLKKDVQHAWEEVRDAVVLQNKKEVDKARKKQEKMQKKKK